MNERCEDASISKLSEAKNLPVFSQTINLPVRSSQVPTRRRMKILIVGHTFVKQLFISQKRLSVNADIVIDGLSRATVDQVAECVYTIQKNPPQFDAVIIHIGSFDLLNKFVEPAAIAVKNFNVARYLQQSCGVSER